MEKKISILRTSIRHFAEKGIDATRVSDIATALGMSKKTIYLEFQTKEDLVVSSFREFLRELDENLNDAIYQEGSFVKKLVTYIERVSVLLGTVSEKTVNEIRTDYPDISSLIKEYINNSVFNRYLQLLKIAAEDGSLNKDVSPESVAMIYRDVLTSYLTDRMRRDLPEKIKTQHDKIKFLIQHMVTIFRGLLTDTAIGQFDEAIKNSIYLKDYK